MIIVYESKTGFTRRYADMLGEKTGLKVFQANELSKAAQDEDIIFLGWMKAGKIQGLDKLRNHNVKAVCASGIGRTDELNPETVITRNKIEGKPFFYLRGGCLPLNEIKGADKLMLSMLVKVLKNSKDKNEKTEETLSNMQNGFDGVKEENLLPVLEWLNAK